MSSANRYQIVFQLPDNFFATFEEMVEFEAKLMACMPSTCEITGHDIGAGSINFFVYTSYPQAVFLTFRKYLGTNKVEKKLRVAYRNADVAKFEYLWISIWPKRNAKLFELI